MTACKKEGEKVRRRREAWWSEGRGVTKAAEARSARASQTHLHVMLRWLKADGVVWGQ
jgi:hypothetical protein